MDYKEQIEALNNLEAIAYGYNINGEVLGMDCIDFEQTMVDAAESITDLLARAEAAEARAEKAEKKLGAAIKYIRHYGWCAGCKHFRGIRGCSGPGLKNCTEQNDHYEFGQKEE